MKHALVRLLFGITSLLFTHLPLSAGRRLGAFLGDTARILLPRARQRAATHLAIAFDGWNDGKRARCLKENFRHYGITLAELFHLKELLPQVRMEGGEHIAAGRCLVVTGHCGNWELLAHVISAHSPGLTVIAREAYLNILNRFLMEMRSSGGVETILRGSGESPRQLLTTLKSGRILGILIDQDTRVDGVWVPFFGRDAHTPIGAAHLARKYDLPVIMTFIHRSPSGRYVFHADPPMPIEGLTEEEITARMTRRIEEQIRAHPTQWVWVHRRWKKRPPMKEAANGS